MQCRRRTDPLLCPAGDILTGRILLCGDDALGAEAVVYRDVDNVVLLTQVDLQLSPVTEASEAIFLGAGVFVRRCLVLPPDPLLGKLLVTVATGEAV